MDTAEALRRMLAGSSLEAEQVAPDTGGLRVGAAADAHDVAGAVEGLSMTNLGPGRDRPFIRGVADSPFNGFSQTTVSVVIDDARVIYDAPEPGLRLVDVARVEVLKGPQGPLYGTGALGGVYRIVTNRPVLGGTAASAIYGLSAAQAGGPGADASLVLNMPLVGDTAAMRLVGYTVAQGGWIKNAGGRSGVNGSTVVGSRLSVRVMPAAGRVVDLGGTFQRVGQRDSQYVDRDAEDLTRSARIAEPAIGRFGLLSSTVEGAVGDLQLMVASSHAWQDRQETYAVGAAAMTLGLPGAQSYVDRRSHRVFDQKVRLASAPGDRLAWVAGASYLSATTLGTGELTGPDAVRQPYFLLHRAVSETALYADLTMSLSARLKLGVGGRLFRATTDDERREEPGATAARVRAKLGFTPSSSLSFGLSSQRLIYLRLESAFRPGGLDPKNTTTGRYDADEVTSVEFGTRLLFAGGRLSFSGDAFGSTWANIQSDYLEPNGLSATHNAADARI